MPTKRASSALLSRIAETALREFGRSDLYVAQAPAGVGLSDAHLEVLQRVEEKRLDDAPSTARLVEISRMVDCIQAHPEVVTTPSQDPGYLSDVFPRLLENVKFPPAPLSDDERRRYEQAQAILFEEHTRLHKPAYDEFCILRADLDKKDVVVLEMRRKLQGLETLEEQEALKTELDALEQLCTEKRQALEALDRAHGFRAAEGAVDSAERVIDEVPASVRAVLDNMELLQITDPISNVTHVGCSFFPSHLAEDNWAPLKLTSADIARGEDRGQDAASDPNEIDDSDIDSIELEVQTLVCERHWLWTLLFDNPHWEWDTPSAPLSTGSEGGLIPAYIFALIFARNLTVRARPSAEARVDLAATRVQPTSSLLMRAIMPMKAVSQPRVATTAPSIAASVAPLVSRRMATPTVAEADLVGPAVVRPASGTAHAEPGRLRVTGDADRAVRTASLRDHRDHRVTVSDHRDHTVISKLAVQGRVVDEEGHGIYQATVTLEGNAGQRRVMTGQDGGFTFPTIDRGAYRIRVQKAGFTTVDGPISVPPTAPRVIRMGQAASCQVLVRLQLDGGQPFLGAAKVVIQSAKGSRLESMEGRSQAIFSLPPGDFTIAATSTEAERISPPSAAVRLVAGSQTRPTLAFTISRAPLLRNPHVQLLGFVCRKVPPCPALDPALRLS